ncbi:MAG TPA: hypothetical protein VK009_29990 [Chloroflexota bacterium]|nr:hypothetical protein [Chloroflexota bacterium]
MAIVRLPGQARKYVNTDTGEVLSRRQAELTPKAQALGFPSSSAMQAARRYEKEHPPAKDFTEPKSMLMLVRDSNAPGAYEELMLTPVSFRDASLLAFYWVARSHYLNPDTTRQGNRELNRFEHLTINTKERGPVQLLTNREVLRETAETGEVEDFPDLYEAPRG